MLNANTDNDCMELALMEARLAYDQGEVPIGAVLIDGAGDVVARAHNLRESRRDATAHAEIIAIRQACLRLGRWRLGDLTLYVTVEPCPMCAGAIVMARLPRVVYGAPDLKAGGVESLFNILTHPKLNHRPQVTAGIREEECSRLMKEFFRSRRSSCNHG